MRAIELDFDVDNVDPDGISDGQDSSGSRLLLNGVLVSGLDADGIVDGLDSSGTSLTFNGVLVAGNKYRPADGIPHNITILDAATVDQSGATFFVYGKNHAGFPTMEAITGPTAGATVISSTAFLEVNKIEIGNGAACGTVDIGPLAAFKAADGFGHQIDIIDVATVNQASATFTIEGYDADGKLQTEAVTGPGSGATVESSKYFKAVWKITIASGASCGLVDVGTVDEFASKTIVLNHYANSAAVVQVDVTGTIDFDVQVTLQNPMAGAGTAPFDFDDQEDLAWINDGNFGAKTADLKAALATQGVRALRVVSNSFTDTAELQVFITQPV